MQQAISHDSETPAEGKQVITACALIHHDFEGMKKVFYRNVQEQKSFFRTFLSFLAAISNLAKTLLKD